jgi:lipoprotein NlpI
MQQTTGGAAKRIFELGGDPQPERKVPMYIFLRNKPGSYRRVAPPSESSSLGVVRSRFIGKVLLVLLVTLMIGWIGCGGPSSDSAGPYGLSPYTLASLAEFNRGAALLEQYQYLPAAQAFEKVLKKAPDWTAARFNLGLAYFNLMEKPSEIPYIHLARDAFENVLQSDPNHLYAHFSLGLYYQHRGEYETALKHFQVVQDQDDRDPYVLYKMAESLLNLNRRDEGVAYLEKVLDRDPGFISAIYRLATQYQRMKKRDQAVTLFRRFNELKQTELTGGSYTVLITYGAAGKYYLALGVDNLPLPERTIPPQARILFSPDVRRLPVVPKAHDYKTGSVQLPGIAVGDLNQDGSLDLCLTMVGPNLGLFRIFNDGKGRFRPGNEVAQTGIAPCLGDVDNDGDLDLWLGCAGPDQYFENDGKGQLNSLKSQGIEGDDMFSSAARLMDLDSDGDLDFLAVRQKSGQVPANPKIQPAGISIYNNNRDGTFTDVAEKLGLTLDQQQVSALVADDFDNDRDLDIIVFMADDAKPLSWVNDRVGAYHILDADRTGLECQAVVSATTGDPDKDGDRDLLVFTQAGIRWFENQGEFRFVENTAFTNQYGRLGGTGGQFVDMDNDGDLDIVIADARRRNGTNGPALLLNAWPEKRFINNTELDPGNLLEAITFAGPASCVAADFTGDHRCDILLAPMDQEPYLFENITVGGNAIQIDLVGKRTQDIKSRSNNSAIGARVEVKTGPIFQQYVVGVPSGPVALAPYRIHAGLGPYAKVDWLRMLWPDAVLQAELELAANQVITIPELQRKISSCPHLFAWDGSHFAFISDFGGMGGLGYMVAPGEYAPPDPTEYVPVPGLQEKEGEYVLQVLEPLEEVVYFDEAKLIAVDHPQGTQVYPNEMMAVNAAPSAFELFGYERVIDPVRSVDHRGQDVTENLLKIDRQYAGTTQVDHRFMGFADEHFVELDFSDQLQQLPPDQRIVLFLYGWVEYGYSSTNYAAQQAGMAMSAPTIEVWRDGQWQELFGEVGYPAGINHMMTLEVTGKLLPSDRRIRITSNMELFWDRIFLAPILDSSQLPWQEVALQSADLHYLGYPREYTPDGSHPNLYDYGNIDRAAGWKIMSGGYTRFGEVTELLHQPDDQYVIMGRGEELTLRFDAAAFGPVPAGCTRSFILKTDSYCKDMDLYTAHPDTVEPLPFHGMSGYPYGTAERYPDDEVHRYYLKKYNTRTQ